VPRVTVLTPSRLWLGALLACSGVWAAESPQRAPAAHTVVIENMQYSPAQLRVHRGERIVWVNKDLFPHTVTAAAHAFDSGNIAANSTWAYVAGKAGEYAYGCTFHPTMKGTIEVQ
jgi:plastocyanin